MKILIVDNYDSFTYNLLHYVQQFAKDVTVLRNDAIALEEMEEYTHFIISPGPGLPAQAGITLPLIEEYHRTKPILGVCLGFQAIAEFFGARLYNQQFVAHGIQREVTKMNVPTILLEGMPEKFKVGLYHSWAVDEKSLPQELVVTARGNQSVVMALEHSKYPITGVQFHPESIMTDGGLKIIENWVGGYLSKSPIPR